MSRIGLVIFGATGFTGKRAVEEAIKIAKVKGPFTWAVAGRSKEKLEKVLEELGKKHECDLKDIPVIVADISDENSLNEMCKQAKVIVNCCGPYRFYGEAVIKACIENKTHHVDVSGEPQYMEKIQLDYHKKAKENGVYIVSACGFDSIPADLGVVFLKDKFEGEVNSVESFLVLKVKGQLKGAVLHYGTWESAVHGLAHWDELKPLRKALYPTKLPDFTPKLKRRFPLHKNELVDKWCLPFPGSDKACVHRSQRHFFDHDKERPIQFNTYIVLPNLFAALMMSFVAVIFGIMTRFSFGRKLLLDYPKLFSFGFCSHEGPTEETLKNNEFTMTLFGEGWTEKLAEPTDQHTSPPNKKLVVKISGTDPGYGCTGAALVLSGLAILNESDKMPDQGGVYPPGAAFAKTKLIQDLNTFSFKYEVVE